MDPRWIRWMAGLAALVLAAGCGGGATAPSSTMSPIEPMPSIVRPSASVSPSAPPVVVPTAAPRPVPVTFTCPIGSAPDVPGALDQARPPRTEDRWGIASDTVRMVFDRDSGRIVLILAVQDFQPGSWGLDPVPADDQPAWETWTFDVCTNTWARMTPDLAPVLEQGLDVQLVHDVDSDLTVAFGTNGAVWAYDLEADTWTRMRDVPDGATFRFVYDPLSGRIVVNAVAAGRPEVWMYDVDADTWASAPQPEVGMRWSDQLVAYDPSIDRIIAGGHGPGTWLFDLRTGSWTMSGAMTPIVNTGYVPSGGEIAFDEWARRTVVFSDGLMVAYDAARDRWVTVEGSGATGYGTLARLGHWTIYDPVNERLVVYGGQYRTLDGWVSSDDVLARDSEAGEWMVLLGATEVKVQGIADQPPIE